MNIEVTVTRFQIPFESKHGWLSLSMEKPSMHRKVKIILNPMADMGNAWRVARDLRSITEEHGGVDWSGTVYPGHAKTVIWEHPYPFFDFDVTIADTFFCVDNSASIALDRQGKAHVVFGINRVMHEAVGANYSYFPYVDGIGYWNEDMPTFSDDLNALAPPQYGYENSELVEDYNYIGWTQDVDGDDEITFVETSTGFPMGYRERLESKLRHKDTQIARIERLLQSLPAEQKPAFETLRAGAVADRDEIQKDLDELKRMLDELGRKARE